MKRNIKIFVVSLVILPVISLSAMEKSMVNSHKKTEKHIMLIAANDNADLQPADAAKAGEAMNKTKETKPAEEESKVGFIIGVVAMLAFMVFILLKTRGIDK